jgi:phospholipase/lecithinase/hemolysin
MADLALSFAGRSNTLPASMKALFCAGCLGLGCAALPCAAAPFEAIYAFGDSLTDTGNEPAEPVLHYEGRWSNGPLWIEYLSSRFRFPYSASNNFAHSGAQCDDTFQQVQRFTAPSNASRALFVVWAGGNDFLQQYDEHWFDDAGWNRQIAYSVSNLSNAVLALQSKGARAILVPNTVDVTEIPTLNYLPDFLRDYLRGKVRQFNRQLDASLAALRAGHPEVALFGFDFFAAVNSLLSKASLYGFTEKNIDALADVRLLDKRFDGPGANYVFWDPVHPTTKAHALVADMFHATVAPAPPRLALAASPAGSSVRGDDLHLTQSYTLQRSADLIHWSDAQSFLCTSAQHTFVVTNNLPQSFYRLRWAR